MCVCARARVARGCAVLQEIEYTHPKTIILCAGCGHCVGGPCGILVDDLRPRHIVKFRVEHRVQSAAVAISADCVRHSGRSVGQSHCMAVRLSATCNTRYEIGSCANGPADSLADVICSLMWSGYIVR